MPEAVHIRDFICDYSNPAGVSGEVTAGSGLSFPDAYLHRNTMAQLSRIIKAHGLGGRVDFLEAIVGLRGQAKVVGQACIKGIGVQVANGQIRELVLK